MHPLDADTTGGFTHLLDQARQHGPAMIGAAAAATRTAFEREVSLLQLLVAVVGLSVTFGGILWALASKMGDTSSDIKSVQRETQILSAVDTDIRRRQEINEGRISKLEIQSALDDARQTSMEKQHADIYQAIRELSGKKALK